MFRRTSFTVLAALALYLVAMAVVWTTSTALARHKTFDALRYSRATFDATASESLDNLLWYTAELIIDEIGPAAKPMTVAETSQLAQRFRIDELNVVASNGITIASNFENVLGDNFNDHPETREFMRILQPGAKSHFAGQPFRKGAANPEVFCKYFAMAYPDRSGFIELGCTMEHFISVVKHTDPSEYDRWRIGQYGHYGVTDLNGNGLVDVVADWPGGMPEEGVLGEECDPVTGERNFTYDFAYAGLLFRSVIPEREFHEQRNQLVRNAGIGFALVFAFLSFFFIKLARSSEKLDAMHRDAEARNAADLAVARTIQLSALPRAELFLRNRLDVGIEAVTFPARIVGGDYYDMFSLTDGRIAFLVADVSGKGVPAAMFMHVAKNAILNGLRLKDDLADAVTAINEHLCRHNDAEMFVTAWIGVLNPQNGEVEYVNAGHNRPYLLHSGGEVERIDGRGGPFLGMFPGREYVSRRLQLRPGESIFIYTDGVTEAMDAAKHTYGDARLRKLLATAPDDLCAAVRRDVDAYTAGVEQSDDLTMLTLTWHATPPCVERTFVTCEDSLGPAVEFLRSACVFRHPKCKARLVNAADEIVSNVVNYSGAAEFVVSVENVRGRSRVTISDAGRPYDPLTHADPDTHLPLSERQVGGLGILMTKRLVDSIGYERRDGRNVLTMVQLDLER